MKKITVAICSVVLFAQAFCVSAGQLSADVALYKETVKALESSASVPVVREYLQSCLDGAKLLDGLEAGDAAVSDAFKKIVEARKEWPLKLDTNRRDPAVAAESAAYNARLQGYVKEEYIRLVSLQDELFERKYFQNETSASANFIEGAINSHWSFTRADRGNPQEVLKSETLGVSPWEAIVRLEPTYVFEDGGQGAVMGTIGLTRTFFPEITHTSNGATFDETLWSKTIQKVGLRAGIGVGKIDEDTKLLLGLGVQVWSVGIWGLYEPDDSTFLLGVSLSDLSKLKKVVGWFD
jgi:hypothetical protein